MTDQLNSKKMFNLAHKINLLTITSLGVFLLATTQFDSSPSQKGGMLNQQSDGSCQCSRQADSLALVDFYARTNGPTWKNKWDLGQPIDKWYGVVLNEQQCVRCLDMDGDPNCTTKKSGGNQLSGILPDLQLPQLEFLSLGSNKLGGIVPNFHCLPQLKVLHLSSNLLEGDIPDFQNLSRLVSLELDYNQLGGNIPNFRKLPKLQNLYLNNNQLEGDIPPLEYLSDLKHFIVHKNQLVGEIPDFRYNPKLRLVRLASNRLKGEIPDFSAFGDLKFVDLSDNELQGNIPDFSQNSQLKTLLLNDNKLKGSQLASEQITQQLEYFSISKNQLDIEDLQKLAVKGRELTEYDLQKIGGNDTLIRLQPKEDLLLLPNVSEAVADNQYYWYKDDSLQQQSQDPAFFIEEANRDAQGVYHCEITHPDYPGFRLMTPTTTIMLASKTEGAPVAQVAPVAKEDAFRFVRQDKPYLLNVIGNDEWSKERPWKVEVLSEPQFGYVAQSGIGNLRFFAPPGFEGSTEFEYQLCYLGETSNCSKSKVRIDIQAGLDTPPYVVQGLLTPNGDGREDRFRVKIFEEHPEYLEQSEFAVYDAKGSLVFRQAPFENNWAGTYMNTEQSLASGAYFYVIRTRLHTFSSRGTLSIIR
ncbi:MAG: gliding motility-associated C-terminal domain-containing protein [Bacteroidota bacterium]